jgi:hypothetical protein
LYIEGINPQQSDDSKKRICEFEHKNQMSLRSEFEDINPQILTSEFNPPMRHLKRYLST